MNRIGLFLATLVVPTVLLLGGADAQAQLRRYKGRVVVTQKPLPAQGKKLQKFLKKNATTTLKAEAGGGKWKFNFYAVLRKTPPTNVVAIVFYEHRGGRFKYINAEDLTLASGGSGLIAVLSKYALHSVLGFKKGKRYQMRLAVKDARGREVVYAKSSLLLLK